MSKLKHFLFPLLLIALTSLICLLNYSPNTFLTGWDTLHPEFNFSLNFKRLLFDIWHSEQGLGSIPAHTQMADLPRVAILYLFHFFLPLNFLRYSYIFLCFIIGPLGIYFLIKNIFQKDHHQNLIAFLTAIFYIFNLSTVQQFFVPFEMFPTQWAFLPWIILFSLKYLQHPNRRNLIFFSLFTLLATPQAYAAQLWYAFFAIYSVFLFIFAFLQKTKTKPTFKLFLFTLLLNAFWLIPNIFYILTSSDAPRINHDNRLYSQEFLLKNRQNGNLSESTIIKGFYFDWNIYNFNQGAFENLMPQWNQHLQNPLVLTIGYSLFVISLIGLIFAFIKKDKLFISFSPFFIIPFVLLNNKVPIFSQFFDLLILNSTIKESFRFIFTKLSTLLLFGLIIFFSYSLHLLFQKIKSQQIKISSALISLSLIVYAFPIFQGYLISPKVRINIPHEYFQFWQFMSQQKDGHILSLPLNQSSGWQYYNWGYQGSGFIWFNLKQNLLDRDSDRWNDKNEQSYREFFNTLYSQQSDLFSNTLNKYQIRYIVWDQNMTYYSDKNSDQVTFKNETSDLLTQLENQNLIQKINQFGSISIYQTNNSSLETQTKNITNFITPQYQWGFFDSAASTDYITDNRNDSIYYPFRDLLNQNQKIDTNKIKINQLANNQWQIDLNTNNQSFSIPSITSTEDIITAGVYLIKNQNNFTLKFNFNLPSELTSSIQSEFNLPQNFSKIEINGVAFPINPLSDQNYLGIAYIFTNSNNFLNDQVINFNFNQQPTNAIKNINLTSHSFNFDQIHDFKQNNDSKNYTLELSKLPHTSGYIIAIKNKFVSGLPLRICFRNNYSFICSVEDELNKNQNYSWDYFLIPPTGNDFGYQLSITDYSFGGYTSESSINQIAIIPIPFHLLNQIKSENKIVNQPSDNFLILNQSFNRFWLAFYWENGRPVILKDHVLSNNWANAWKLSPNLNTQIYFVFWPKIFEVIGFGIAILALTLAFKKSK